jgi:hypothetical protein
MCTVPLPPGVNPIAVDKYININISYHITYHIISYRIMSYIVSYHIITILQNDNHLALFFSIDPHTILTPCPLTNYCLTYPNIFPPIITYLFAIRTGILTFCSKNSNPHDRAVGPTYYDAIHVQRREREVPHG